MPTIWSILDTLTHLVARTVVISCCFMSVVRTFPFASSILLLLIFRLILLLLYLLVFKLLLLVLWCFAWRDIGILIWLVDILIFIFLGERIIIIIFYFLLGLILSIIIVVICGNSSTTINISISISTNISISVSISISISISVIIFAFVIILVLLRINRFLAVILVIRYELLDTLLSYKGEYFSSRRLRLNLNNQLFLEKYSVFYWMNILKSTCTPIILLSLLLASAYQFSPKICFEEMKTKLYFPLPPQ